MSKLTYLSETFRKTKNKKYEHFVITSIYYKINNFDLKPVTQQKVFAPGDSSKYYLLDLYFPQLNYGVEVDEPQHQREENIISDMKRAEDIFSVIKCDERRVVINNDYNLEDVNNQIDGIVKEIKGLIKKNEKKGNKLEWIENDILAEESFNKKRIEVSNINYKNYSDIWQHITGEKIKSSRCYVKSKTLPGDVHLWVPTLTMDICGKRIGDKRWENILSENKDQITEFAPDRKVLQVGKVSNGEKRAVFMKMRDEFNNEVTRFVGVFQHSENIDTKTVVYKKVEDFYEW